MTRKADKIFSVLMIGVGIAIPFFAMPWQWAFAITGGALIGGLLITEAFCRFAIGVSLFKILRVTTPGQAND